MATDTTKTKKKRTRSNKPKRFYMLYSGPQIALEDLQFAKNGDEALDLQDAAAKAGKPLNFLRVFLPATPKKEDSTPAS